MANTLKIKRGTAATIPQGQLAEPLFTTDTYDLYIGKGSGGNQRIQNYIASGTSSQFLKGDGSLDSNTYQTALTFSSPLVNTSGTVTINQSSGTVDGYLSSTDWTTFNSKEPAITAGTTLQYYRGDKTFQTLDTSVVPENGPIYFTEPRVRATVLTGLNLSGGGTIAATDSILTAFGKVQNQISALVGGATYQGTWNASTNTPTLASGTGTKGYYYVVSVAGSTNLDGITDWKIGDWAIFNGTTWDKVDNTDAVSSVNGFTGSVNLALDNISDVSAASPTNAQLLRFNGTSSLWENWTPNYITGNQTITLSGDISGSGTTTIATTIGALKVTNAMLAGSIDYAKMDGTTVPTWNQNTTGNAATATKLATARDLTINGTAKSFDGSANVSWTAAEIGLTSYLPLAGGTLTGTLNGTNSVFSSSISAYSGEVIIQSAGTNNSWVGNNVYYDNQFKYKRAGYAQALYFDATDFEIRVADTGVADDTITWTTPFRVYSSSSYNVEVTTALGVGVGGNSISAKLDVAYGGYSAAQIPAIMIGADIGANTSRTANTRKIGTIAGIHYNNTNKINLIRYDSDVSSTELLIGGSPELKGPTIIDFYTATTTTATPASRFQLTSSAATFSVDLTASKLIKSGGTSSQFLKADGSVDSNTYALNSALSNYLPLSGGTLTGALSGTSATFSGNAAVGGSISSWASGYRAINIGSGFGIMASNINYDGYILSNAYYDGSWKISNNASIKPMMLRLSDGFSFQIGTTAAVNSATTFSEVLGISNTGAATFSSSVTAGGNILASSSSADTSLKAAVVGDYFPRIYIQRSGGTTKTNNQWSFDIGSNGNLFVEDVTGGIDALIFTRATGAATFSSSVTTGGDIISTKSVGFTLKTTTVGAWTAVYGDTGGLYLGTNAGNWMFINNSGNVGINTISPQARLDIQAGGYTAAQTPAIMIGADIGTTTRGTNTRKIGNIVGNHYDNSSKVSVIRIDSDASGTELLIGGSSELKSATYIDFYTATSTTAQGSSKMLIRGDGSIMVGTTAATPANCKMWINLGSTESFRAGTWETYSYAVNNAWLGENVYFDGGFKRRAAGYATALYSDGSGGFQVRMAGTSSAGSTITWTNAMTLNTSYEATFAAKVTATSFFESSDIRLKTNIQDYKSSDILNISAKIYEKDGKIEVGYLAQDLESILKSAVSVGDNGYLDLSYRQVHTAKIAALENKIKELEAKLK